MIECYLVKKETILQQEHELEIYKAVLGMK